jgi:hypothetical protein
MARDRLVLPKDGEPAKEGNERKEGNSEDKYYDIPCSNHSEACTRRKGKGDHEIMTLEVGCQVVISRG